jgi:predicted transcriptional regulator
MRRKEKNEIFLSPKAGKIALNFCRTHNRDINEFLEEAIFEKIEFEEFNKDAIAREQEEAGADTGAIFLEEPGDEEFKRKH